MRFLLFKILVLSALVFATSQVFAQSLELGMPHDSVMIRMRQARMREGGIDKAWDVELQPAVFADLSGIYWLGFDKSQRLEYIKFEQHVGDRLPSSVWTNIVSNFKKQKLDSLKEQHEIFGDSYQWKRSGNSYSLSNVKGLLSYTAAAPSAAQNPRRRLK